MIIVYIQTYTLTYKQVDIAEKLVCQYDVANSEIAILTPYSAQKEVIKEKLTQRIRQPKIREIRRNLRNDIQVKTITESQGEQFLQRAMSMQKR